MPTQTTPAYIVDAFTDKAFAGNPAAVCILNEIKSDQWLQQVAAEFNLSETAFLLQRADNSWQLRWFTPSCEVKLCGHATLASAHVLLTELLLSDQELIFSSLSGSLKATRNQGKITLDFPKISPQLLSRIFLYDKDTGINQLNLNIVAGYQVGEDILLELENEDEILQYQPDFAKISSINTRGLIITAKSATNERDFVSRFFAPRAGINEDPVTGSAHCSLAEFWSKRLGKSILRAEQLSSRRGILDLEVQNKRVKLIGSCVTVMKGELVLKTE
jgi:PhzF family phenazine biosynthesis protein